MPLVHDLSMIRQGNFGLLYAEKPAQVYSVCLHTYVISMKIKSNNKTRCLSLNVSGFEDSRPLI